MPQLRNLLVVPIHINRSVAEIGAILTSSKEKKKVRIGVNLP